MKTIGFVISGKENEKRRALLPEHVRRIKNRELLSFEEGYATHLGIDDSEYEALGCVIRQKPEVYDCDVICNPKAPEPDERALFSTGQTLFGWIHAVQGRIITDFLIDRQMTGIAWEDMYENGRHCFWRNNEIAGEAAVIHAMQCLGRHPQGLDVAIIGRGNCARGAYKTFSQLGANITNYDRSTEKLLRQEVDRFDVIVNAVLWDVLRKDHILYIEDLKRMRQGSLIIDISCDEHMGIESSVATTIGDPVYMRDGIMHYAVDHTPAIFYRTATEEISKVVADYIDEIAENRHGACLKKATVVERGKILDERVLKFQNRR
ncbi:MAG: ceo [Nitrospirae bacterium]|nr:MAG: ceo [Nitrospirota bacterium]